MSTPARILLREGDTTPPAPTDGQILFYAKTGGVFYSLDSDGNETPLGGGGGSVSVVSVVPANGISGSVANATTTPAITLSLGAITPTSVAATGTVTGSNISGSTSGTNTGDQTITLTGDVTGSGTGSFAATLSNTGVSPGTYGSSTLVPVITVDTKGRITSISTQAASGSGTVTSVGLSGGTTGITITGSPIIDSGVFTLGGTLAISHGGTGSTTAQAARNALLPNQSGNAGRFLTTNGTDVSWAVISGTGTVTSVSVNTANGVSGSVSNPTTTPAITLSLGAITPTSVAATGTVTGSNLSGTNTGDQTITLTGDVTGSGTGSFAATLSNTGVSAGTYGSSTQVPVFAVDAKGRITSVTNTTISGGGNSEPEIVVFRYSAGGSGNFNIVDAVFSNTSGVSVNIADPTNCIVEYTFTGKNNPPKSIITYAQVFGTNEFTIKDTTNMPNAKVAGGGTASNPSIITSFTTSNIVTLQTRMSDTGASAGLGQRAHLMVVFGF